MTSRINELKDWLLKDIGLKMETFEKLLGDASSRHYFRISGHLPLHASQSFIAMDSPPAHEKNHEFLEVNHILAKMKVRVPQIYAHDLEQGFMLIEDFGQVHFFERLNADNKAYYYQKAIQVISDIQAQFKPEETLNIPVFSKQYMRQEIALFEDWFLKQHLDLQLDKQESEMLNQSFDFIIDSVDKHPKTLIHRDFHSRNLMILQNDEIGIIDYQDAMLGPRTYDLVSLLKDCYIKHSTDFQLTGLHYYQAKYDEKLVQEFTLCGLQRHLKVLGIFARLHHRDAKDRYLDDLPLVMDYTLAALADIPELESFKLWLQAKPLLAFQKKACL